METKNFSRIIQGATIYGDISYVERECHVLCLHGGGPTGRIRFWGIREAIFGKGLGSCAFDYKGHGESGGQLSETSLEDKVTQTLEILEEENIQIPRTLIAVSMGGYVAIKMTQLCEIENLILIVPAVYSRDAYTVPFGSGFSEIIRRPGSWDNTDAWDILREYKGNLILISAENDMIIPKEVITKIFSSAINVETKELFVLPNCPHAALPYLKNNSETADKVITMISGLLQ